MNRIPSSTGPRRCAGIRAPLAASCFALAAFLAFATAASAAPLDLNGVDRTVTDVTELNAYDGVTNSSATLATLTFNLADGAVQSYGGVISGNIRLVKDGGKSRLSLTAANTYTGGTLIKKGILVAGSATACGDAAKSVEIESRVQVASTALPENGPWCTLQIDVSGFANPIILPTGTDAPRWVGNTFIEHSLCVTNGGLSINSPISGGRFTFMAVKEYATNKAGIAAGNVTFNGPITCTGISIYSTGNLDFRGAVTNSIGNISGGTWRLYPTYRFYSSENQFNGTSFTGTYRYVHAMADNVFNGLDSFAFGAGERVKLYLNGHDVTIGRVSCTSVSGNDTQMVDGGSGATSVLRMRAGENTISSAFFNSDLSLVWDPTGDYTFTATSNRTSTLKGPLVVKGGTFELDGGHTMSNVTNIIVKSGATLKVSSAEVPFASSVTIDAGRGATLDLAVDMTAESAMSGHNYLDAGDYPAGTYNGLTITGAGTLHVTTRPVMTQASLQAAIDAVADGGSVYVANDIALSSSLSVTKAGTFTLLSPEGTNYTLSITKESATITPALLMNHTNATCRLENVTLSGDYAKLTKSPVVMVDVGRVELGDGAVLEGGICGMWLRYRGATALMEDGAVIRNCQADSKGYGFGVRVGWSSIGGGPLGSDGPIPYFTMRGGAITNNACEATEWGYGGTVYVGDAVFEMTGGAITGNSCPVSSGVWLNDGSTTNFLGGTARVLDNTGNRPGIAVQTAACKVILRGDFRGRAAWSYPVPTQGSTISRFTIEEGATGVWNLFAVTNGVDAGWIGKTEENANAPTVATWAEPNGWIGGTAFASKEDAARSLPDALTVTADREALVFSGTAAQATKSIALDFDPDAIRASGTLPITLATSDVAFGGGLSLNLPAELSDEWAVRRGGTSIVLDLRHPPTVISFR